MPSLRISFSVSTSTSTPSAFSSSARAANSTGPRTLAGSLTRSRASMTPSATAARAVQALLAAAGSLSQIAIATGSLLAGSVSSGLSRLYLSKA